MADGVLAAGPAEMCLRVPSFPTFRFQFCIQFSFHQFCPLEGLASHHYTLRGTALGSVVTEMALLGAAVVAGERCRLGDRWQILCSAFLWGNPTFWGLSTFLDWWLHFILVSLVIAISKILWLVFTHSFMQVASCGLARRGLVSQAL